MFYSPIESVISLREPMPEPKPDRQRRPVSQPGPLGENQIAWLRARVPAFSDAWKDVQKADAHKARIYDKLNVEPGSVGIPSQKDQTS